MGWKGGWVGRNVYENVGHKVVLDFSETLEWVSIPHKKFLSYYYTLDVKNEKHVFFCVSGKGDRTYAKLVVVFNARCAEYRVW